MSDNPQQQFPDQLNHIYATLDPHDVEQFYADYQLWHTRQRIAALQEQIDDVHRQIAENAEQLEQVHPPAVALATLVRLQAKDVNDIDLLDRMLERGEEWLDFTMQRLDYCEQLDFIHDNYTQWCEHALEGAYDWIDSMRDAYADTKPRPVVKAEVDQAHTEATEELLLRKLTSEESETSSLANTLKRPAASLPPSILTEETPSEREQAGQADKHEYLVFASALEAVAEQPQPLEMVVPPVVPPIEIDTETDLSLVPAEQANEHEYVEFAPLAEVSPPVEQVNVDKHEYVEFAPASGTSQETKRPQESEMVIPPIETDTEADSSLVPAEQAADEHEYIEFAPGAEVEADSSLVSAEQANEHEYVEFAPVAEVSLPVETAAEIDSSPVPVEDAPPVLIEEVTSLEHPEPAPTSEASLTIEANAETDSPLLPIEHATHVEETPATAHVQQEEPASPVRATNVTYNWLSVPVEHKEYPAPAQEVKPQRRPGFWRRLFSIFRL